ncbi:DUF4232 domain-containing protein [Streptomyces sp. 7-21]|uniref:DUF4232 domain-containing protein n=1 Tax=Streptomyces sp. 7-21 TaxID=2802283 RepID=UPI00191EB4FF|nr:DUF4232 domain-containing protein [Streptomyces sp. 7-21]MBL1065535.1 DUF4232 domain-containing protein [Streptomyces sp. 7-21]
MNDLRRAGRARRRHSRAGTARPGGARASRAALVSGTTVLGLLLCACGSEGDAASGPEQLPGLAQPVPADNSPDGGGERERDGAVPAPDLTVPEGVEPDEGGDGGSAGGGDGAAGDTGDGDGGGADDGPGGGDDGEADGTQCSASDVEATVGEPEITAGNWNYPIVLTNVSGETCTLYGYPGVAFQDADYQPVGQDPWRDQTSQATTVSLGPGESGYAVLRFGNPGVTGAPTEVPSYLAVTPPDTTITLTIPWNGDPVPVTSGSVKVGTFQPGTG